MRIHDLCTSDPVLAPMATESSSLRSDTVYLKDRRASRPHQIWRKIGESAPNCAGWPSRSPQASLSGTYCQDNHSYEVFSNGNIGNIGNIGNVGNVGNVGNIQYPVPSPNGCQDTSSLRHGAAAGGHLAYYRPGPAGSQPHSAQSAHSVVDWGRWQNSFQPVAPAADHMALHDPWPASSQQSCAVRLPFPRMPPTPPTTSVHPATLEPSASPAPPPAASALSAPGALCAFLEVSPPPAPGPLTPSYLAAPSTPPVQHVSLPRTALSPRSDSTEKESEPDSASPVQPGEAPECLARETRSKQSLREDSSGKKARVVVDTSRFAPEFACPFYKRNRRKYWHQRSCRTSGWPSVHRVKEHLYRHHMHFVCARCSEAFKDPEKLRKHLRQSTSCRVSRRVVDEDSGFDQEVEKRLRSRKKIEGQDESDKWAHMFRLLFPSYEGKATPLPYVDYDPRDEGPPWTLPQLQAREDCSASPVSPDGDGGDGNSSVGDTTSAGIMAMVAAAAEQKILAVEAGEAGPALLETSIRRMVEQEVRAALSNRPSGDGSQIA